MPLVHHSCRLLESRWALPSFLAMFLAAIALQWNGPRSIAVADEVAYVTSGVNLVTTGCYTNPFGQAEVWFPPVYPTLIGLCSLGGWLDPFVVARLISVFASLITLIALYHTIEFAVHREPGASGFRSLPRIPVGHGQQEPAKLIATLTVLLLAANPTFQDFANRALSESLALCLSVMALRMWLCKPRGQRGAIWIGITIGLATLTRPECVLLAPLFCVIDLVRNRDRDSIERCLFCGVFLTASLFPYAAYLHEETGHWTISHKGAVNLAAGRAAFHQTPREYINEITLELGYFPVDTTLPTEVRRIAYNARKLVAAFNETYFRPLFATAFAALAVTGAILLWRRGYARLVAGLLAGMVYLGVVVIFDVGGPKNLHLALPTCSLFAATTLANAALPATRPPLVAYGRLVAFGIAALLICEGSTRYPRWVQLDSMTAECSLRTAGLQLQDAQEPRGVMYEFGASTAYYSGMRRRYLTPNSLDTILSYIDRHEPAGEVVYLTVSTQTQHAIHASTRALLETSDSRLEHVLAVGERDRVVVYRVKRT